MTENQIIATLQDQGLIAEDSTLPAKYPHIKKSIRQAVEHNAPGTKLPPMRKLALAFGVTVPPVQRAVAELVREKLLVTRVGSGTFVSDEKEVPSLKQENFTAPALKRICMGLITNSSSMMNFWQQAVASFQAINPRISVTVKCIADMRSRDEKLELDIIERPTHFWIEKLDADTNEERNIPLLNLEPFTSGHASGWITSTSPFLLPIHTNVQCLYYNARLLRKLQISPPEHDDFETQHKYLLKALDAMEHEKKLKAFMICHQQPAHMLGSLNGTIISLIRNLAPVPAEEQEQLLRALDQIITLKRRILSLQHLTLDQEVKDHSLPGVALFSGYSYSYPLMLQKQLLLQDVHPLFAADNSVPGVLVCGGINRDTANPIECMRFLGHLRTTAMQQKLMANLALPPILWNESDKVSPPAPFNSASWRRSWSRVQVEQNNTSLDLYIRDSIINDEIWQAIYTDKPAGEVLKAVLHFGRAYLDNLR